MYFDAHSDIWNDVTYRRQRGETDILRRCHLERLRRGRVEEKFYIFLGIEGLASIGSDLSRIDVYHDFGCRHAMLTWNEENALATGVHGDADRGLTETGRGAVRRIQEKGMVMDVSHLNENSFWDVMDATAGPVIASHSNAKALCDVPRNLADAQLRAIRDTGGVVGLNAYCRFVDANPDRQTAETLARHAAHMIDVMGIDHVGCGFDFCEFLHDCATDARNDPRTAGLEDCSQIPNLFACLAGMGVTEQEMQKIAFGNFHDLLRRTLG